MDVLQEWKLKAEIRWKIGEQLSLHIVLLMAFCYKPVTRWTRKRRLDDGLRKALHAIDTAVSDSDYDTQQQVCVNYDQNSEHHSGAVGACDDYVSTTSDHYEPLCAVHDGTSNDVLPQLSDNENGTSSAVNSESTDTESVNDISDADDDVMSQLREWAAKHNASHESVRDILQIFRTRYPELPKDPRTVLQTYGIVQVRNVAGGSYHHFGLIEGIKNVLNELELHETVIKLQVNIDGLPLFRSSNAQFWPILGLIANFVVKEPFIVGLFYGNSKPSSAAEYLEEFIQECSAVQRDFLWHMDKLYTVQLTAVVCDMPARTFVKNVKGHTGYHGCDKCIQEGLYVANRMTFPQTHATLRTDESFASLSDSFHHLGTSPFSSLSVGMITCFPIDYMHAVCLGVVRKLLYLWMKGPLRTRLGGRCIEHISDKLLALKRCVPSEFARKPRSLAELDRWKATELRQFVLYTGPVCLNGVIPREMYENFMLLSSGVYILLSTEHCKELIEQAQSILLNFVEHFSKLYGEEYLSYNVHAIVHLADEAKLHGVLDNVSCFVFENHLGKIKKLLRKPDAPLQQVVKRLSERTFKAVFTNDKILQKSHHDGPVPSVLSECRQFREFHQPALTVSLNAKDSCVLVGGKPAVVRNFLQRNNDCFVAYQEFSDVLSFYSYPFQSERLNIFCVSGSLREVAVAPISQITRKYCYLTNGLQGVVIPLLH